MSLIDTIRHLFDPPVTPCGRSISEEEEADEHKKWRDSIHENRGASQKDVATARRAEKASVVGKTEAERVFRDMIKILEKSRRGQRS